MHYSRALLRVQAFEKGVSSGHRHVFTLGEQTDSGQLRRRS